MISEHKFVVYTIVRSGWNLLTFRDNLQIQLKSCFFYCALQVISMISFIHAKMFKWSWSNDRIIHNVYAHKQQGMCRMVFKIDAKFCGRIFHGGLNIATTNIIINQSFCAALKQTTPFVEINQIAYAALTGLNKWHRKLMLKMSGTCHWPSSRNRQLAMSAACHAHLQTASSLQNALWRELANCYLHTADMKVLTLAFNKVPYSHTSTDKPIEERITWE